ncbi:diphosphonucleotide phosphatase 1, putative [Acanthamoeba castellanii str. Neff]|uniref:Purple acid phosphatase n=1 Tax=Acanthamoeba castellanii (strain ATCC 30010 / Neff) TaxID=1257118 RepID=L8H162_ACACF|nr:diphosphonucleotide phosphatase 1, putative [Acanthamoeba castellanii str. Neff]ELR18962.1 diphosphonucleotide phosphatase 1, putative [Acanthamoeba castellanii str. Neff]
MARSISGVFLVVGLAVTLLLLAHQASAHGSHAAAPKSKLQIKAHKVEAISIGATPATLQRSGEWVVVSWRGVDSPSAGDWIGVYSPANASVTTSVPIKYKFADESTNYLSTGAGSVRFRLTNMRADYAFHFFRHGITRPTLVATSNAVTFVNYNEPMQGRLMLTGRQNEMRVMWTTRDAVRPQVKFGTSPGNYDQSVGAATSTYRKEHMCGAPANAEGWRDPGLLHSAVLSNLRPDTRYYYVYGDPTFGFSAEASFVSEPHPGQSDRVIHLFAFGDMGKTTQDNSTEHWDSELASINTTTLIAKDLDARPMDLLLHIGDIAYAVGYGAQWDEFHDQVSAISTRLPYMTCIGNHERDFPNSGSRYNGSDSGGECGVAYEARYPMPTPARDQPWYSFDYGFIHFTFMSTEHDFSIGSVQWKWLEEDLKKVDRVKTPWVVFSGHRPMYIDSQGDIGDAADQPVARELRANVEDLLFKYQVDLALWGHHHSYQRSCPVYKGTCIPSGRAPTHVVIGMAGFSLTTNLELEKPTWARVVNDQEHGYTRLAVTRSRLEMEFISDVDTRVKDHFALYK